MQIKKFLIITLIFTFMFETISQAEPIPTSTTLKQGIYSVSSEHNGYYRNIKLITPDKSVTLTIIDSNGTQKLFVKLSNEKEYLKVGPIEKGETLIITGDGEISIVH